MNCDLLRHVFEVGLHGVLEGAIRFLIGMPSYEFETLSFQSGIGQEFVEMRTGLAPHAIARPVDAADRLKMGHDGLHEGDILSTERATKYRILWKAAYAQKDRSRYDHTTG